MQTYVRLHCTAYAHAHNSPSGSLGASAAGVTTPGALTGSTAAGTGAAAAPPASAALGSSAASHGSAAAAAAFMLPSLQPKPLRQLWVATRRCVSVCCTDKECEVYAIFDPLTDKSSAADICAGLQRVMAGQAAELLVHTQ
jgi:hypothetical protein